MRSCVRARGGYRPPRWRPESTPIAELAGERDEAGRRLVVRKSPKISEVLLHLHGLASGDFVPALEQFLGSAAGLSPATIARLTAQ